jgi:sodium/bile acid cotransporter 7
MRGYLTPIALILAATLLPGCQGGRPAGEGLSDAERCAAIERMADDYEKAYPDVPEMSPEELAEAMEDDGPVVVDGREPEEIAVSRIPGAIPLDELDREAVKESGRRVVVYCTIGYRSGLCARDLRDEGIDAWNLRGSILAWAHAGEPLVTPEGEPTQRVHVYGPKWALAPSGYESVY